MVPDLSDEGAPREWTRTTLGHLVSVSDAELKTGPFGTVLKAGEYTQEGAPVVSVGEIRAGRIEITEETPRVPGEVIVRLSDYVLQEGDIVFARKGGVERSALVTENESGWFLGSDGIRLRLPAGFHPPFVAHYLQASQVQNWLTTHSTGSTMPSLSQKVLRDLTLPCPPLAEQRKIAAILSSVDEAIAATRKVVEQTKRVKQGLLQTLMTRGIGHTRFKKTEIGEIPEGWEVQEVQDLAEVGYGVTVNLERRQSQDRVPLLTVAAHDPEEGWRAGGVSEIGVIEGDREKYAAKPGDILLVEGNGNPEFLGRPLIWDGRIAGALHQNHLIRVRPLELESEWITLGLSSPAATRQVRANAKSSSGLYTINSTVVRTTCLPVAPAGERRKIITLVESHDEAITEAKSALGVLSQLKSGLMQDLLTGRVRVPLD